MRKLYAWYKGHRFGMAIVLGIMLLAFYAGQYAEIQIYAAQDRILPPYAKILSCEKYGNTVAVCKMSIKESNHDA